MFFNKTSWAQEHTSSARLFFTLNISKDEHQIIKTDLSSKEKHYVCQEKRCNGAQMHITRLCLV